MDAFNGITIKYFAKGGLLYLIWIFTIIPQNNPCAVPTVWL